MNKHIFEQIKTYLKTQPNPVITLTAVATMLSCSQTQKQANATPDAGADTLSSSVVSADSLTGAKRHFVNGYVFIYNVLCESQDKKMHEHVSEDSFCFDNYEFPLPDCISFLRDSNDVLYYCPPVQDDIPPSVFMTKEQFQCATKAVKAYYDAPDTWIERQEYVFVHRDHDDIKRIKKICAQDPNAVIVNNKTEKTETLYRQSLYTVDGHIFPELFFIDDSTVVINQTVYHRAEETIQVMYDSDVPTVLEELPAIDMPQYVSACRSAGTYVVTSDGGKYEYEIQLWKDTCDEDLDFIVFNKLLISCDNQIKESISDEFDWLSDAHYKADAAHPFYTFSLENGCTMLVFEINGRPDIPTLLMYVLKEGSVTRAYCEKGAILGMKNENGSISIHQMTEQGEWSNSIMEGVDIYYSPQKYGDLFIRGGKLIRVDYN